VVLIRRGVRTSLALVLLLPACTDDGSAAPSSVPTAGELRWETLASLPTARSEVAAATDGERVLVAGGFERSGATIPTVEVLDLATITRHSGPDLPLAVNHPMAAGLDGTIVVVGGYQGPGLGNPTDRVFALRDGAWEELPPMPAPRAAGGATVVEGRLYVAGGVGPDGRLAEETFVFDPSAGLWSVIEGQPTGREHLGVAGLDGELFVVGGRTGGIGSNLAAAEALDLAAGSWRALPRMPTARGGSAATATSNGYVVSAGGEADRAFDEAEAYDVRGERWLSLPPMPTARHGLGVVAVGTVVYAIAGGTEPGLSVSGAVEAIDLAPLGAASTTRD
jgi:Kelch motif protein